MDNIELIDLFTWTEEEFFKNTEGSPIRRIGYDCWKRNIAIALGNADTSVEIIQVLKSELGKLPQWSVNILSGRFSNIKPLKYPRNYLGNKSAPRQSLLHHPKQHDGFFCNAF